MQRPRGKNNLVLVDINEKSSVDGVKSGNGVKEWKRVEAGGVAEIGPECGAWIRLSAK